MTPDTDKREGLGEGIYAKFVQNYEKLQEENKKLREEVEQLNNDIQNMDDEYMALLRAYNQLKEKI